VTKVKIGDKAPNFTLPSNTGEKVSLSQFQGKKNVVLYFYPMNNSPICTREANAFKKRYDGIKKIDGEVVGVSSEDVLSQREFARKHKLPFILLSDEDNKVRKLYGVPSTLGFIPGRVTYIIDEEGIVRHVLSSQFQPEKHAKDALQFLEEMS
jgi:peroxiredoxin Q/BCP